MSVPATNRVFWWNSLKTYSFLKNILKKGKVLFIQIVANLCNIFHITQGKLYFIKVLNKKSNFSKNYIWRHHRNQILFDFIWISRGLCDVTINFWFKSWGNFGIDWSEDIKSRDDFWRTCFDQQKAQSRNDHLQGGLQFWDIGKEGFQ